MPTTVAVLHGDQTGEELLREAIRLLDEDVIGLVIQRRDFDLSLEKRRETRNQVVLDAAEALRIGLANSVVADDDLESAVQECAERLAAQPPRAVSGARRAIDAYQQRAQTPPHQQPGPAGVAQSLRC